MSSFISYKWLIQIDKWIIVIKVNNFELIKYALHYKCHDKIHIYVIYYTLIHFYFEIILCYFLVPK